MNDYPLKRYAKTENVPTKPKLWQKMQDLVSGEKSYVVVDGERVEGPNDGEGFKKHPSAYSNGWAVKKYNEAGGDWREKKAALSKIAARVAGLDEWFDKDSPEGDWVAIDTTGKIIGPCAQSDDRPDETKGGADPLKCMPRSKAHGMTKEERAKSAKRKKYQEKSKPNRKKPVHSKT